ncbi:cytochrome P450 [Patulibacter medicamentivorans]|uniref:cytochrome P450 n=1 Tax=Patulibacter medicamentivorans TaxID=1097667 RepID=UPI0002EE329F|nr:cytochrome P450 [Patulibacter medicamentivorans]
MTATHARTPRMSGVRVISDVVRNGLGVESPIVRGIPGEDIASFRFNRRTVYILKHPDYVDHVFHGGVDRYHKSIEYEMLRAAVGLSLFTDEDESWRRHRMMINPVLAKRHLTDLFDLMVDPIERFVARYEDDPAARQPIEMTEAMTELTLDVVGSALFGRGMADLAQQIGSRVTLGLRASERAARLMLAGNPPTPLTRAAVSIIQHVPFLPPPLNQLHDVLSTIDDTVWKVIHDRQANPGRDDDLLGLLLSIRDDDGEPLPLRRVRDEACTFMLAGHETTANAMAWMWHLLAINHEARDRMLAEVDEVLGDRRPAFDDVRRLPWTTACVMEAMRLFSPAWIVPRVCVEDDEIDGHRIRKGSVVIVPVNELHHDERFWPDPEVFDPTRFLPENGRKHHRSAYLPFGGGRRVCAGQSFALIETTLITAMMSRCFTYEILPGHPIAREATMTIRPRYGMPMVARRRATAATREAVAA